MTLTLRPARVAAWLLAAAGLLTALSVAAIWVRFGLGHRTVAGLDLVGILHLDADVSIPGWFSASILLASAVAVALVAAATRRLQQRHWLHWAVLAAVLCYLSADEAARLHEQSAGVLTYLFERDSFFTRSWTVPAAIASLAFAAAYVPFLLRLEPWQCVRFVAAGGLYLFGAAGMEVLGHYVVRRRFPTDDYGIVPYQTMVHVEEVMEMAAVVLLLYAALRQLEALIGAVRLRVSSQPHRAVTDQGEAAGQATPA